MRAGMVQSILVYFIIGIALSNAAPFEDARINALNAWQSFVSVYGKTYASDEESQRRKNQFVANYLEIQEHNQKYENNEVTYLKEVNQFTDLSSEEFISQFTGLQMPEQLPEQSFEEDHPIVGANPTNYDLRNQTVKTLTAIKNQGGCGSCWAFATIATIEGAYNKKKGSVSGNFSEQLLVDCDLADNGCNGGWPTNAFIYLNKTGLATEAGYAYTATRGTCRSNLASKSYGGFVYTYATNLNDTSMQTALVTYGPLTVTIDATPLQSYSSGVISYTSCSSINHAVNVVGYVTSGTGAPYYIMRNSWSKYWGDSGYFKVSAASNACFIRNYVWYAKF